VQGLLGLAAQVAVDADQVLRLGDFAGNNDLVAPQAALEGQLGGFDGGLHHAVVDDLFGVEAEIAVRILLHLAHDQFLVERAAIDADPDGLAVIHGDFADRCELFVAADSGADIARVDAVLIEGAGAVGVFGQQDVPVVVEIANDGRLAAEVSQAGYNLRHGRSRLGHVHGDADQLRSGVGKFLALRHRSGNGRPCPCWSSIGQRPARRHRPEYGRP